MQVLKNFGLMAFLLAITSVNSFAQTKENPTTTLYKLMDPIEFVQKVVLNPKSAVNINNLKPAENTNCVPTKEEIIQSRMVTKTPVAKKTEASFSSTMLDWVKDKYSAMIDVMPNQISNVMLYRFIDDWYGVKYRMGGTTKSGVDCSAFVQHLYQHVFGFDLLRTACLQFQSAKPIKNKEDLQEGDLVFFRINTSRISHVGVYLKNNFFVHSACSKGVSIANLNNAYWSKFYAGGGRIIQ